MSLEFIISTIQDGVIDPNPRWQTPIEQVIDNRQKLFDQKGLKFFVRMGAVHGDDVLCITDENRQQWQDKLTGGPSVDSLITRESGIGLECDPGDCALVIIFHPKYKVLGVVHSGREGTIKKIVGKTVRKLAFTCNVPLNEFVKALKVQQAPAICGKHYQMQYLNVPTTDIEQWQECITGVTYLKPADNVEFGKIMAENDTMGVDFGSFIYKDLLQLGVYEENISRSEVCTYESDVYPSHYRARDLGCPNGRFMVIAWIQS